MVDRRVLGLCIKALCIITVIVSVLLFFSEINVLKKLGNEYSIPLNMKSYAEYPPLINEWHPRDPLPYNELKPDLNLKPNILSTTSSVVPSLFQKILSEISPIDEKLDGAYPAENPVNKFEETVGWDATTSNFVNPAQINELMKTGLNGGVLLDAKTPPIQLLNLNGRPISDMMDIVIPTIRDLDFLEKWKPFIEKFHLILVQDGDPTKHIKIPEWADFELYNRKDIERALRDRAWIISQKDASIRNFGFLVSDKDLVYTIDDDCHPATGPDGNLVDVMTQHAVNLLTPATPYFFNTVYDPYRPGSDFVRGYPYSRRNGIQTGVSHGLWMNQYDYDAPTQLLKVTERNTRYHDVTLTIPHKQLYPMCSMNVAFNRELMGPAFMQGLMGEGQPWARYDDMFCGWASKVVGDHIKMGTKSGAPYIYHNKASNPFTNLKKEYMGLKWQENAIEFFEKVRLNPNHVTAGDAYRELADKLEAALGDLHPYFHRLAKAMRTWVDVWEERNVHGCNGGKCGTRLLPIASRSSHGPTSDSTCAIFTITHNEATFLPIWLRHYTKHAAARDIWVLDHNSNDGSTDPDKIPKGVNYRKVYGEAAFMPHWFLIREVQRQHDRLLRVGYKCVMFTEIDEIVVPDPEKYPGGLREYLTKFAKDPDRLYARTTGKEILQKSKATAGTEVEPAIDWSKPLLQQRHFWFGSPGYCKPVLSKFPLSYVPGFHNNMEPPVIPADPELILAHLHSADKEYCMARERKKVEGSKNMLASEREGGLGVHFVGNSFEEVLASRKDICGLCFLELIEDKPFFTGPEAIEKKWHGVDI